MKHALRPFLLAALAILSAALYPTEGYATAEEKKEIVFGATVGDFSDMVTEGLKPLLEAQGYTVRLIQFTDYVQPNIALLEGKLDANIFQHLPYLEQFLARQNGAALEPLAQIPTAPLGLYAGRKTRLEDVAEGGRIAVPNDPTNLARALFILRDLGWIDLPEDIDPYTAAPRHITANPKKLRIVQLEAAQLPRARQDVDYAVINGNYIVSSGLKLADALAREQGSAYINRVVVRPEDKNTPHIRDVAAALDTPEFRNWAKEKFPGYNFPDHW